MGKSLIKAVRSTKDFTVYESVPPGIPYQGKNIGVLDGESCFAEVRESKASEQLNKVIRIIERHVKLKPKE